MIGSHSFASPHLQRELSRLPEPDLLFRRADQSDVPARLVRAGTPDRGQLRAFKVKLRCVFCEHLLSARARARGIPLVDIRPMPLRIDPPGTFDVVVS